MTHHHYRPEGHIGSGPITHNMGNPLNSREEGEGGEWKDTEVTDKFVSCLYKGLRIHKTYQPTQSQQTSN